MGMGEYPGYYCYDPNRPSWLPYWLDSLTESGCKWNPKTIAGNIYACATGDPTCNPPTEAQKNPLLPGPGIAPAGVPTNTPQCGGFTSLDLNTLQCKFDPSRPSFMLFVGGIAAIVFVLPSVMGGRR
jgi:hypothetical protein